MVERANLERGADRNRVAAISSVNKAISDLQKRSQDIVTKTKNKISGAGEIEKSLTKVLDALSGTMKNIGKSFARIATSTTRAVISSISQYSKAITQDISIHKESFLAMTLARSTPIFGYFVAKFMETDLFKRMRERLSESLSNVFGAITLKAREKIQEFLARKKKEPKEITTAKPTKEKKAIVLPEKAAKEIPKLQKGGYVEKGGLVRVHPGEIVAPIDKVLKKVDESIGATKHLVNLTKAAQIRSMARMNVYVGKIQRVQKESILKGFIRAASEVHRQFEEPANMRMLRAVLAIQDTLGATVGTWPQIWQKMLVTHPTFRNLMFSLKVIRDVTAIPFKLAYEFVRERGGYQRDLSRNRNPMAAAAENIGTLYVGTMWRLDTIVTFLKASTQAIRDLATFVTGIQYPAVKGLGTGRWSIFDVFRSGLKKALSFALGITGRGIRFLERRTKREYGVGTAFEKASEFVAKERRFLPDITFKRKILRLHETGLGETTAPILPFPPRGMPSGVAGVREAIPVVEVHLKKMMDSYISKQQAYQKKLLTYTKDLQVSSRGTFKEMKKTSGIWAFIKKMIFFLPNLLGNLLGGLGGGIFGRGVGGFASGVLGSLFGKGVGKVLGGLFKKKTISTIFKKGTGKIAATGAGAIGKIAGSTLLRKAATFGLTRMIPFVGGGLLALDALKLVDDMLGLGMTEKVKGFLKKDLPNIVGKGVKILVGGPVVAAKSISEFFTSVTGNISKFGKETVSSIANTIKKMRDDLSKQTKIVSDYIRSKTKRMISTFLNGVDIVGKFFVSFREKVVDFGKRTLSSISNIIMPSKMREDLVRQNKIVAEYVKKKSKQVFSTFISGVESVGKFFVSAREKALDFGKRTLFSIANLIITPKMREDLARQNKIVASYLRDKTKRLFSTIMEVPLKIKDETVEASKKISVYMKKQFDELLDSVKKLFSVITQPIKKVTRVIGKTFAGAVSGTVKGLSSLFGKIFSRGKGEKLSDVNKTTSYTIKQFKELEEKSLKAREVQIVETKNIAKYLRVVAKETLASSKRIAEELKKQTEEYTKTTKEAAMKVASSVFHTSNQVITTINNNSNAVVQGRGQNKHFSDAASRLMQGTTYATAL